MTMETFCSNIFCSTAVGTDKKGHLDVHKQIETEKWGMDLHPIYGRNENKFNGGMASDV